MTNVHSRRDGDYMEWMREVDNINSSADDDTLKEDDVVPDIVDDEIGRAAIFLKDLGLITLANNENSELFDLLTKNQKQTINRRLETVRPKTKSHHIDVRSVFQDQHQHPDADDLFCTDGLLLSTAHKPLKSPPSNSARHPQEAKEKEQAGSPKAGALHRISVPISNYFTADNRFHIPPPDYSTLDENIVGLGLGVAHPRSSLVSDGKNLPLSDGGRASPLPTYTDHCVVDDGSGVTQISDLGKKDLKMLSLLAKIELQTIFDEHRISYTPHKSKKKAKDHGVYGVSLQTLVDRDRKNSPDCCTPLFIQQLIEHLEKTGLSETGILRVPGGIARMKELRQEIDAKWPRGKFTFEDLMVHDAAGLLKQFLRDLPDSLLTLASMDAFLKILEFPDEKKYLYILNLLVLMLPEVNRDTLLLLLGFLRKVINEPLNLMTLSNVAMIIAPNLFVVRTSRGSQAKLESVEVELQMAERTSRVVMMLIENQDSISTVPSALLAQIRQKNEARRTKINIPIPVIGRKDRSDTYRIRQLEERSSATHIFVSPDNSSGEIQISITDSTTANDVISQMLLAPRSPKPNKKAAKSNPKSELSEGPVCRKSDSNLSPLSPEGSVLFEVGGNIGERRLDGGVNLMSVIQVNPNAKFVVRPQKPV